MINILLQNGIINIHVYTHEMIREKLHFINILTKFNVCEINLPKQKLIDMLVLDDFTKP